jgi:hypothetical protein
VKERTECCDVRWTGVKERTECCDVRWTGVKERTECCDVRWTGVKEAFVSASEYSARKQIYEYSRK